MDFGFVRGSNFNYKTNTGKTVTSIDGKNAYLAIIDRSSRYMWIFPTSSKKPPITEAKMILEKFKSTNSNNAPATTEKGDRRGARKGNLYFRILIVDAFNVTK